MIMVDYDVILNDLGPMTTPQKAQLVLVLLPGILAAMHMAGMMFLGYNQNHLCSMPLKDNIIQKCNVTWSEELTKRYIPWDQEAESLDKCLRYKFDTTNCTYWTQNDNYSTNTLDSEQCDSWTYDTSVFTSTIVSDFDLVCDDKQKRRLSQAIFMLGVVLGTALWGQISDRFGRKVAIISPMAIGVGVGIATAYASSFLTFTILRFFIGLSIFPAFSCSYVLASETVKMENKVWVGQTFQAAYSIGICLLPGLAYFVKYWRTFQLCLSVPGVLLVLLSWYILESPRWLISSSNFVRANRIVKKYTNSRDTRSSEAKKLEALSDLQSKRRLVTTDTTNSEEDEQIRPPVVNKNHSKQTVIQIWKLPNMRRKSFILYYVWMVTSMIYYGLTLNAAEVGGNPYFDAFLSGVMEIPASYAAIPMMQKWGRRPSLISTLFLAGVSCACMMFVSKELVWLNVTLFTLGKFSISATFGIVYILTAETYPTPVRNVGLGVCSSMARVGAMLAPFIAMLDVLGPAIPYVAFGLLALLGGSLGLLLPETLGKKIPETLEESEQFGKHYEGIMATICGAKDSDSIGEEAILDETKA